MAFETKDSVFIEGQQQERQRILEFLEGRIHTLHGMHTACVNSGQYKEAPFIMHEIDSIRGLITTISLGRYKQLRESNHE